MRRLLLAAISAALLLVLFAGLFMFLLRLYGGEERFPLDAAAQHRAMTDGSCDA